MTEAQRKFMQIAADNDPTCEWCHERPAVGRIVGTDACSLCIQGGPKVRIKAALQRWERRTSVR